MAGLDNINSEGTYDEMQRTLEDCRFDLENALTSWLGSQWKSATRPLRWSISLKGARLQHKVATMSVSDRARHSGLKVLFAVFWKRKVRHEYGSNVFQRSDPAQAAEGKTFG